MTTAELHLILDDENRKLSLDELTEIIYQLKWDVYDEAIVQSKKGDDLQYEFYLGEENAFYLCLSLLEHLDGGK